jgi:peptidoglycan/xylan/chitin deacetylase (PgdA/CDA1 family)
MTGGGSDPIALAEQSGETDAARYMTGRLLLRECGLGAFSGGSRWIALVLRRALLFLRVAPRMVGRARPFVAQRRRQAFDGFVLRYAYWTGVRRAIPAKDFAALVRGPVILMYHAIGWPSESASSYVVPAARFRRQMAWLKWCGFRVIPLADLVADLRANRIPPRRSIVLTFDDGYSDNWGEALPILRRYRLPATVFVVSTAIGRRAWWPDAVPLFERTILTSDQLAELTESRIEIGAHSRTHRSLTSLTPGALQAEVMESRAQLQQAAGSEVRAFAYPFGDCSEQVIEEVASAGFEAACCSRSGVADPAAPLFALPRVEVRGTDSLAAFALLVWRGHRHRPARSKAALQAVTT